MPPHGPRDVGGSRVGWRLPKSVADSAVGWRLNPHLTAATSSQSGNRLRTAPGGSTGHDDVAPSRWQYGAPPACIRGPLIHSHAHSWSSPCTQDAIPETTHRTGEFSRKTTPGVRQGLNSAPDCRVGPHTCTKLPPRRPPGSRNASPRRARPRNPRTHMLIILITVYASPVNHLAHRPGTPGFVLMPRRLYGGKAGHADWTLM